WGSDNFFISLLNRSPLLRRLALKTVPYFQFLFPSNIYVRLVSNLSENVDMENSQVFCPRSELSGLYINDDRFEGVVEDSEEVMEEVMEGLEEQEGVEPVRKEEVYHGENTRYAPDIVLRQEELKVMRSILDRTVDRLPIFNHSDTGVFLAYGGRAGNKVDMVDVAPTILDYFGIEPPEDMDGDPLEPF
ncbi:MAG: hypothetical protein ABEI07_01410, partial [Candidatus Nanohaloarchaea archaeon]